MSKLKCVKFLYDLIKKDSFIFSFLFLSNSLGLILIESVKFI